MVFIMLVHNNNNTMTCVYLWWLGWIEDGIHTVGSCRPLSRFMVPMLILMWMASVNCSLPVSSDTSTPLDCGTSLANCMDELMGKNTNAILWVSSFHCLLVLPSLTFSVLFLSPI